MRHQYKGALHIHTTISDGAKSPEETLEAYKAAGYDFVALTDHWVYGEPGEYKGMKILSGAEYDTGENIVEGIFHIVGIGMEREPFLRREDLNKYNNSVERAQHIIECINEAGGAAILAHPAWSVNRPSDIIKLRGLAGIEIYNAVSGFPYQNRANSAVILDILAADGFILPVHAADDTHFWKGEECSSFVLTTESDFVKAVKEGNLYASRGPRMEIKREGNTLHIECTPASMIIVHSCSVWVEGRTLIGDGLTSRDYVITAEDMYARVEVIDKNGNSAWSGFYKYL